MFQQTRQPNQQPFPTVTAVSFADPAASEPRDRSRQDFVNYLRLRQDQRYRNDTWTIPAAVPPRLRQLPTPRAFDGSAYNDAETLARDKYWGDRRSEVPIPMWYTCQP